jgi:diaminohydroxyphosphoribosylaminopyrimidine deaminase/5-amino-6-(5-phosphoribosylamino)uracil reductase
MSETTEALDLGMAADAHAAEPLPAPADGLDTFWAQCLQIVTARRAGRALGDAPATDAAAHTAVAGSAMVCTAARGWALRGRRPRAERDMFALLKPLLDCPAGGPPWLLGQLGQSLNGCVATASGDSCYISDEPGLLHLHRLRALCDAVIVGAGTVAIDNPQLTTRRVPGANPVRVVLDPGLRTPPESGLYRDGAAPTLLVCDAARRAEARARWPGVELLPLPAWIRADGSLDLQALVRALHARGLQVLLVEGGGVTVSRFIEQQCLHRLHLSLAPVLIGGGRPGLQLTPALRMADCPRPPARVFQMGDDVLWDLDLATPAG